MVPTNAGQKYQELRMFPNPQDALPLPRRPNVERYRQLAKELVKACRLNEPDAIAGWSEKWIINLVKQSGIKLTRRTSRRVQRWIDQVTEFAARELRNEATAPCRLADARFVIARSHGFQTWTSFIRHINGLNAKNSRTARFEAAVDAIVEGDIKTLKRLLQLDSALIRVRSAREHRATLLHYVSANGVEGYRQKTPRNIVKITELLLQAGAEIDAEADVYGGGATTLGLAATSVHPYLAGVQNELMQILLDYGAEIDHRTSGGNQQNAVRACLANGRGEAAVYLAERGARLTLTTAAGVGKLDVVEQYFARSGKTKRKISEKELQSAFRLACLYGRTEVVKFLLQHGIDLHSFDGTGQTALHSAAIGGQLEVIKLLLEFKPPLEIKNMYGGTVLGQTLWSAAHGGDTQTYVAIIDILIEAGAKVPERHVPVNAEIDDLLRRYGSVPEPSWYWYGEKPLRQKKKRKTN